MFADKRQPDTRACAQYAQYVFTSGTACALGNCVCGSSPLLAVSVRVCGCIGAIIYWCCSARVCSCVTLLRRWMNDARDVGFILYMRDILRCNCTTYNEEHDDFFCITLSLCCFAYIMRLLYVIPFVFGCVSFRMLYARRIRSHKVVRMFTLVCI